MTKLNYNDKVNLYNDRKNGYSISSLCSKYNIRHERVEYITRLIDRHGFDVLRTSKNQYHSIIKKKLIIERVLLNNESINSVAIDEGLLSRGMLVNWIKNYQNNGYNIVERKHGRSPTIMKKPKILCKESETEKEKIKRLEEENLYLKAELEYSKKLRAVVQARKNQQQKKK